MNDRAGEGSGVGPGGLGDAVAPVPPPTPGAFTESEAAFAPLPADHPDRVFAPEAARPDAAIDPGSQVATATPSATRTTRSGGRSGRRRDRGHDLAPSASLGPDERVVPSWTDPTVRRASSLIGGPLGRHAQVGRNVLITPLRVCLLMAIFVLALGWLAKSPCIQTKGDPPVLDQGGEKPWLTGCYNDVVPLYGSRGLNRPADFPYANSFIDLDGQGERRIYPAGRVNTVDGQLQYVGPDGTVQLSDQDVVGDAKTGYRQVRGGALVTIPDIAAIGTVRYLEYPVLTGVLMWGISWVNQGYLELGKSGVVPQGLDVASYFSIGAIVLSLCYLWAVMCTARMARKRVWDTAIMCLAPLLIVHAFTNWDLLAVGLTAGGMFAWSRKKPGVAGILLGLGMAAKLYPILLLGPLLVLCLRSGRMPAFVKALVGAVIAWAVVNVPVMLQYPDAWYEFIRLNSTRAPEYDSWYFIVQQLSGSTIWDATVTGGTPTLLNAVSLVLFLIACAAIGWLALSAQRRPRFAQLAFLVVTAFLLTNKVWSPQYSIWLLPLVALALPRWRPVLIWQFAEAVTWLLLMLQFAGVENKGLSIYPFIGAAIIRGALVVMLAVLVIREIIRPARDLVRQTGDDDPTGGVLEDAPDRFTLPSLPMLVRSISGRRRHPAVEESQSAPGLTAVGDPR